MDESLVDRIARIFGNRSPRRLAVRALAGLGLTSLASRLGESEAGAKRRKRRKRRCRTRLQSCGGRRKCCKGAGPNQCQALTKQDCFDQGVFGRRCCGLDGASCDLAFDDCDCCGDIQCFDLPGGPRCVENPK